jgi:hypothetical protein
MLTDEEVLDLASYGVVKVLEDRRGCPDPNRGYSPALQPAWVSIPDGLVRLDGETSRKGKPQMQAQALDRRPVMAALAPVVDAQPCSTPDQRIPRAHANRWGAALWSPAPIRHPVRKDELPHHVGLLALQHVASLIAKGWG